MAFFNDMDRLSLKLLSPSGLELFAKNIQEAFNNGHKYRKIEDCNGIVEYLKAIRDGEDGSEELFNKYIKVVDIGEKVTEKKCCNCMSSDIWPSKEPCLSCISSGEIRPNWKPKKDTSEQAKKNINDIFGVDFENDRIKHIEDRVESIQANVLEYGNNCVSKLIELKEKVGLSPDADIYLHDIRQDLCDLDMRLQGLESTLADIHEFLNEIKGHEKLKTMTVVTQKKPITKKPLCIFKIGDVVKYKGGNGALYTIVGLNERSKWYRLKSHSTSGYFVYVPGSRLEKVEEESKNGTT